MRYHNIARQSAATIALLAAMSAFSSVANATVVVDSLSNEPLPRASVFDCNGNMTATCSDDGTLPVVRSDKYPLTVRYLGYMPATLPFAGEDTVRMSALRYELPEIVIDTQSHSILHLKGYMREYTSMTRSSDTVQLFSEKIVDFMLPTEKNKKFKGWKSPRTLAERNFYRFTDSAGLDSVSSLNSNHFQWFDFVDIFSKNIKIPETLRDNSAKADTVAGKYGVKILWNKLSDRYIFETDMLADKKDHKWSPNFLKFFGLTTDFTRLSTKYTFTEPDGSDISPAEISMATFDIEALCRGKLYRWVSGSDEPFNIRSYYEFYVTDKEYLTPDDAKDWKEHPETKGITVIVPDGVPELEPAIVRLIERVDEE